MQRLRSAYATAARALLLNIWRACSTDFIGWIEYATLGWNVIGVAVLLGAAWSARSVALAGFGLDSLIEIFASVVVIWQLNNTGYDRQRRALRLIGVAFFALALYILTQSGYTLLKQAHPGTSVSGIAWLAV